jgi:membrane dipeptidase
MKVIDLHCDVLYKLSIMNEPFSFEDADVLQVNKLRLITGEIQVQFFAIFISPELPPHEKFIAALRQIELFHSKVLAPNPEIIHITDWSQLDNLNEGEIGAVLTLEGADAIGEDIGKLNALLDAGVKLVGLTWNPANAVAHGADEPSHLGLTPFGHEVLDVLNERNIIVDVSHLNEQSFWDVLPKVKHVLASHSNSRSLCDHPRNLTDLQAKALVEKGGHIHIVYYPPFINKDAETLTLADLMHHFTHFANLVGVQHIGLGSDFDGIAVFVEGLHDASDTQQVVQHLRKHFAEAEVKGITSNNFKNYIKKVIATS